MLDDHRRKDYQEQARVNQACQALGNVSQGLSGNLQFISSLSQLARFYLIHLLVAN